MIRSMTKTQGYYLLCLGIRTAAFAALVLYALAAPARFLDDLYGTPFSLSPLTIIGGLFVISMFVRLVPSNTESLGCQKIYAHRYRPTGASPQHTDVQQANRGALWVFLTWTAMNSLFFLGYFKGWLGERFLVCLAGFYGVCDIVCILFYCPFQSWMMHNRCCVTCRIYDWDYMMICTPLFVIPSALTVIACTLSAVIFLQWEITYVRRKERFFVCSNAALQCSKDCPEQLCKYKQTLRRRRRKP
jgi:hypothetical protein